MATADSFEFLTEDHAKDLDKALETLQARVSELSPGETLEYNDSSLKPIQHVLDTEPSIEQLRAAEFGLGEILQKEFDLDWVTATRGEETLIALNIPCTENVIFPHEFFKQLKEGHGANARVTYLKWADFVGEHAFD